MKNTNNKYKLNFKTMKKGLLTLLAASLVFVGCQNYDDQFDDLNAQISALKSQVDGLSSLSGQVASLSGTISGLQAGIAAAASSSELSALSTSLASLQANVDAVQASIASTASAAAVATLQAEIDAIETDLADLLTTSNIYSTAISVTNATTLEAALALGNKINVLNADLTVTGYSGMDYAKVQTLVDRINTMTGAITYTAYSSTGTEVVFNNLASAGNITMTQPGGYHFPKLTNAAVIDLKDDYETLVTRVNFPVLTTVTGLQTDATADTIEFTYATSVDFGSLVTAPGTSLTITTKKDATLDLGSWVAKDASGNNINFTLTLTGPASFTNGTAAGTFASTGLPGNTLGMHDGTISLTTVATAAIHNFRGAITLGTGVKNFTGNNVVTVDESAAVDLETYNVTYIRDNDPSNSATTVANFEKESNTAQDDSFSSSFTKLTSVTITGKGGDVTANAAPALTTVNLSGLQAFDVNMTGNTALTSFTDASSANDWTFDNNDVMTSVNAAHTTALYGTDTAATVSVSGNAEITSLTIGFDDVDSFNVTSNAKLATIAGGTNLKDNGTSTTTDVDIHQNALVASLVRNTKEAPSATVTAGATSDTGSVTTSSGIKDLDAFLTDAIAATGIVSVWFDTVSKLEIQSTYGGSYTDTTSSLTAPTAWDDTTAAANAVLLTSGTYAGNYGYVFSRDASSAVTSTTGARESQMVTYVYDVGRNAATYTDKALATNEGFTLNYTGGSTTWKQGDTYNGATVTTVDQLVAYMNADTTLDGLGIDVQADRDAWYKTLLTMTYEKSATNGLANVAGTTSGTGNIAYSVTKTETGAASLIYATVDSSGDGVGELTTDLQRHLNLTSDSYTLPGTNANQLLVIRSVSGGTASDHSPLGSLYTVTPVIDAAQTSTTVQLLNSTGTISNTLAQGSNNFTFDVAETQLTGIRVTLKNVGTGAFASAVSLHGAAVSNTALLTDLNLIGTGAAEHGNADATNDLLDSGNAPSYANDNNMGAYLTAYSDITAGTTTTTTAAVTAVTLNRTGW